MFKNFEDKPFYGLLNFLKNNFHDKNVMNGLPSTYISLSQTSCHINFIYSEQTYVSKINLQNGDECKLQLVS